MNRRKTSPQILAQLGVWPVLFREVFQEHEGQTKNRAGVNASAVKRTLLRNQRNSIIYTSVSGTR